MSRDRPRYRGYGNYGTVLERTPGGVGSLFSRGGGCSMGRDPPYYESALNRDSLDKSADNEEKKRMGKRESLPPASLGYFEAMMETASTIQYRVGKIKARRRGEKYSCSTVKRGIFKGNCRALHLLAFLPRPFSFQGAFFDIRGDHQDEPKKMLEEKRRKGC